MIDKLALLHPLLFSIIFIIMPFTQYAGLIPPVQVIVPFIVICALASLLYFIIRRIVKKSGVAVAILSPLLILFFNYGTLYEYISSLTNETKLKLPVLALIILLTLIVLIIYNIKVQRVHEGATNKINKAFCVIACALIIFNVFTITMQSIAFAKINDKSGMPAMYTPNQTGPIPDIYFIILDEYASPSQMKSYFNYDMSPFVEYLKKKGFLGYRDDNPIFVNSGNPECPTKHVREKICE